MLLLSSEVPSSPQHWWSSPRSCQRWSEVWLEGGWLTVRWVPTRKYRQMLRKYNQLCSCSLPLGGWWLSWSYHIDVWRDRGTQELWELNKRTNWEKMLCGRVRYYQQLWGACCPAEERWPLWPGQVSGTPGPSGNMPRYWCGRHTRQPWIPSWQSEVRVRQVTSSCKDFMSDILKSNNISRNQYGKTDLSIGGLALPLLSLIF